jgi:hypothetical protein
MEVVGELRNMKRDRLAQPADQERFVTSAAAPSSMWMRAHERPDACKFRIGFLPGCKEATHESVLPTRVSGSRYSPHLRHAGRWPAGMQADLGIRRGPILRNATINAGAKMDRRRVRRCIALRRELRRIVRARLLAAQGNRA